VDKLEAAVDMAIVACDGDLWDTVRALVVADSFLADLYSNGSKTLDPENIDAISTAFGGVLKALGLTDGNEQLARLAGIKIIELATAGERDPERLKTATLKALRQWHRRMFSLRAGRSAAWPCVRLTLPIDDNRMYRPLTYVRSAGPSGHSALHACVS
jgi:hypothetical protein